MTRTSIVAVGIDVGGTFTDLAAIDADGQVSANKVLSQPRDRAAGVLDALDQSALPATAVAHLAHGTTVVTNLLLERAGARVVVCATAGFTDLLELRRQERAALYDLSAHHPPTLVPLERIVAITERITPDGVETALDARAVQRAITAVTLLEPDTVAIALLHAYADSTHERQLRDALKLALPDCDVICAHEVLPEIREYERTATTVAEAYARPAVRRYLEALSGRLFERGFPEPRVMTSAGGTLSATLAAHHAAALALSGPAGGVAGAAAVARMLDISTALTIDIGGTSADVGLIVGGEPLVERGGAVAGVPIALPRVLVEPVAAGGGSIGWIDEGGALRAGPHSAGADPGPAAYDRGGVEPTITDAHVVLGHVPEGTWSGGVTINGVRARSAMQMLATRLGVSMQRAADALIATADATMARALRRVSVERGIDPRDATLIAFGGAGPLHACGLADRLGMTRIIVPPHAGVLSAVGLALAPERREGLTSLVTPTATLDRATLANTARELEARLRGTDGDTLEPRWWVRSRYIGQGYELDIAMSPGDDGRDIARRFVAEHETRLGFALDREVECVSLRAALVGVPWTVRFARGARATSSMSTPQLDRDRDDGLELDRTLVGPAVMRLPDATMYVAKGWHAQGLPMGGWLMEVD